MQVEKNRVVAIDYTLKDENGRIIDTSEDREPLSYIQGIGNLIPGVESALEGKSLGERVEGTVAPESGCGIRDDSLVLSIERSHFSQVEDLEEGLRFRMDTPDGPAVFTVVKVEESGVLVDGLNFDIMIKSIREASAQELEHGHVHS